MNVNLMSLVTRVSAALFVGAVGLSAVGCAGDLNDDDEDAEEVEPEDVAQNSSPLVGAQISARTPWVTNTGSPRSIGGGTNASISRSGTYYMQTCLQRFQSGAWSNVKCVSATRSLNAGNGWGQIAWLGCPASGSFRSRGLLRDSAGNTQRVNSSSVYLSCR